ncbi:hypothetical protein G7046_g5211 [Stylonectria norvegica]|nr:hypothetical protein G7046_g5211 [Stylonectria norvegica]
MAQAPHEASWNPMGSLMTEYSFIVKLISLACLGFGLLIIVPLILLLIMDILLWLWRTYWNTSPGETRIAAAPDAANQAPESAFATGLDKST